MNIAHLGHVELLTNKSDESLRLALTGLPIENYLGQLWSLFNFTNPGLLGSHEAFQKRFAGPIERDGVLVRGRPCGR